MFTLPHSFCSNKYESPLPRDLYVEFLINFLFLEQANNFVRRLAVSNGLVKGVMLGASMNPIKDKFVWADGTNWDYDNFGSGQSTHPMGSYYRLSIVISYRCAC